MTHRFIVLAALLASCGTSNPSPPVGDATSDVSAPEAAVVDRPAPEAAVDAAPDATAAPDVVADVTAAPDAVVAPDAIVAPDAMARVAVGAVAPDFMLPDQNPNSRTHRMTVAPSTQRGIYSVWYFASAT
jgi:hypothetical protein